MSISGALVAVEHLDGRLSDASLETIGAARSLIGDLGGPLVVVVIGGGRETAESAGREGVDLVLHVSNAPEPYDAAIYEAAICNLAELRRPRVILMPHTVNGMGCAPAIAARLGAGLATDVFQVAAEAGDVVATRSGYRGRVAMEVVFPHRALAVLTIRGATFPTPRQSAAAVVQQADITLDDRTDLAEHIEYRPAPPASFDIGSAEFVFSIGRGVGDRDSVDRFARLAGALGATLGCSRPIVDAGWLPRAHQVGQSGNVAKSCKLYLAVGISGAVQHLHGMKHVETVIAVNKDPKAPIFLSAKYGACVDLFELADALEAQLAAS